MTCFDLSLSQIKQTKEQDDRCRLAPPAEDAAIPETRSVTDSPYQKLYTKLLAKHQELLEEHDETERELKGMRDAHDQKDKVLMTWKGVEPELKKMNLESLHELETNMISSLQNVRKVINNKSEQENECRVCRDRPKDTALFPCGHSLCSHCVCRVNKCPMCRAQIERSVKLL